MLKSTTVRIGLLVLIILSVWLGPWWLALIGAVLGAWFFRHFYELLIPALLFDVLYGFPGSTFLHFQFVASVFSIILVAAADELRGHFV